MVTGCQSQSTESCLIHCIQIKDATQPQNYSYKLQHHTQPVSTFRYKMMFLWNQTVNVSMFTFIRESTVVTRHLFVIMVPTNTYLFLSNTKTIGTCNKNYREIQNDRREPEPEPEPVDSIITLHTALFIMRRISSNVVNVQKHSSLVCPVIIRTCYGGDRVDPLSDPPTGLKSD